MYKILKNIVLFTAFLGSFVGSIQAGAVKELHKVVLPNGKKIIFFAEFHDGIVNNADLKAATVAKVQKPVLDRLFKDLVPLKDSIVFYLECRDQMKQGLKEFQDEFGSKRLFDFPPSFFDQLYTAYAHEQTQAKAISLLKNFDQRNEFDIALDELAERFDKFLEKYEKSGYCPDVFNKLKNKFFSSDQYQAFLVNYTPWATTIGERLAQVTQRLKSLIPQEDFYYLKEVADLRLVDMHVFQNLNQKARFVNKNCFELLFDFAHMHKENFFTAMQDEFYADKDFISISSFFDICNLLTDLTLLEAVLIDPHPVVLVNCGYRHSENLTGNFFQKVHMVTTTDALDLTKQEYLKDRDCCYKAMRHFILY